MSRSGSSAKSRSGSKGPSSRVSPNKKRSSRGLENAIPYDLNKFADLQNSLPATIQLALPDTPVNVYLNGVLMESNVSSLAKITTESLPEGIKVYKLIIQDSSDKTKVNAKEINLSPGQIASVNMSDL